MDRDVPRRPLPGRSRPPRPARRRISGTSPGRCRSTWTAPTAPRAAATSRCSWPPGSTTGAATSTSSSASTGSGASRAGASASTAAVPTRRSPSRQSRPSRAAARSGRRDGLVAESLDLLPDCFGSDAGDVHAEVERVDAGALGHLGEPVRDGGAVGASDQLVGAPPRLRRARTSTSGTRRAARPSGRPAARRSSTRRTSDARAASARRAVRVRELAAPLGQSTTSRRGGRRRAPAARRTAVKPIAALDQGSAPPRHAAIAGSSASGPGSEPSSMPRSRVSPSLNRAVRSSIVRSMTAKSPGSAPDATPSPTRPGCRAASHATSSATSASGGGAAAGARPRPIPGHRAEAPARGLQRVRQVAGEAVVVLARHHPVEAVLGAEHRLGDELVDDRGRGEVGVGVEPQRHRAACERGRRRTRGTCRAADRRSLRAGAGQDALRSSGTWISGALDASSSVRTAPRTVSARCRSTGRRRHEAGAPSAGA